MVLHDIRQQGINGITMTCAKKQLSTQYSQTGKAQGQLSFLGLEKVKYFVSKQLDETKYMLRRWYQKEDSTHT